MTLKVSFLCNKSTVPTIYCLPDFISTWDLRNSKSPLEHKLWHFIARCFYWGRVPMDAYRMGSRILATDDHWKIQPFPHVSIRYVLEHLVSQFRVTYFYNSNHKVNFRYRRFTRRRFIAIQSLSQDLNRY